jgi:nitrogen regulatory protein P-II 2
MQLYPLKLVTIVGETVIMKDIGNEAVELGATGFTMTEVIGQGARNARNVIDTGGAKTMRAEFVVPMDVAAKILSHVSHTYFEHYACIAWITDVQVVRGQQYTK